MVLFYAGQARDIYQVLPYSLDFNRPGYFEIYWITQNKAPVNIWNVHIAEK